MTGSWCGRGCMTRPWWWISHWRSSVTARSSDIEIRARDASVLVFRASIGRVANLTLRQAGGEKHSYGVDISQGRLDLEGCDISSQSLACVVIRDGADPRLRRNKIHDGKQGGGVLVFDSGLGTLEDNDITGNALSGVEVKTGGNPTLRRNQIHDNKQAGIDVHGQRAGHAGGQRHHRQRLLGRGDQRAATRRYAATGSTTTSRTASTSMTTGWARWRTTTSPATPTRAWRS